MKKLLLSISLGAIFFSCLYQKDFSADYSDKDLIFRYYNEDMETCMEYYRNEFTTDQQAKNIETHYKNLASLYGYGEKQFAAWRKEKCPGKNLRYVGNCKHDGRTRIDIFDLGTYDYIVYSYGTVRKNINNEVRNLRNEQKGVGYSCRFWKP
ncbi:MAG: hypothetical protein JW838_03825 [Spirochaetes bacterium]|nr:hypothetical protein [Spirochaetota bacterium]